MKTKLLISILFLFFSFPQTLKSQTMTVVNGDTIIQITPQQLGKINGIIEEWKWTKEENRLLKEKSNSDSVRISLMGEEIKTIEQREAKKEVYYTDKVSNLLTENDKLKIKNKKYKKKFIIGAGVSGAVGIVVGLLTSLLLK